MKKLNLFLLLMVFSFGLFATSVSLESARSVADNFYKHYSFKSNIAISDIITYQKEGITTFYVFVYEAGGFVIVSADDAVIPILGYSTNETFDKNNIPVNASEWLEQYSSNVKYIIDSRFSNNATLPEWAKIRNNQFPQAKKAVNPLLTVAWDQSSPYNQLCPIGTPTGCGATAMSQIMKYWAYPTTGIGTHSYTHDTYGTLSADFGSTTYQWSNMINSYAGGAGTSTQKTAVATLMYHCGVSIDMNYAPSGSGAYSHKVPSALINYFNYSASAELKFMADFTSANWITMLKGELDESRPVFYSGYGVNGTGGHAFVCDGYNTSNQFHFNWGWSGSSNGYYAIGSLNPSGDNFNVNNSCIVRIKPPSEGPVANFVADNLTPAVGGSVNFTDNSTGSPVSWSWAFEGGTPATSSLQHPSNIVYSTKGKYQVTLIITNSNNDKDTKIRTAYINAGGTPSVWIKQNTGFTAVSRGIDQIFIVDPYIVWAKAYDGSSTGAKIREFTKTVNGGISWTPGTITFTGSTSYGISNIFAISDTICYACMYPLTGTGGKIVKTTNGGTTWIEQSTAPFTGSWANFVHFFNNNDGVCMGDPATNEFFIYTTNNGGTTWTQVPGANIPNCITDETGVTNVYDDFQNNIWFGTSTGRIYKSTDKGLNWTVSETGFGTTVTVNPVFKDALVGIVTATDNTTPFKYKGIKKTTDGGATWTTFVPTGYFLAKPKIDFVPGTSSMWVDVSATIPSASTSDTLNFGSCYSLDDCSSFLNIDTGSVQYTTVTFYDINTGWAGGFNTSSTDGGIYKWDYSALTTFVPNPISEITDEIRVYPNPTLDIVNIEFSIVPNKKVVVNLYNVLGENVISKEIISNTNVSQINLAGNKSGIYLLTIDNGTKLITKRISLVE